MDPEAPFRYLDYCSPNLWEPSSDLSDSLWNRCSQKFTTGLALCMMAQCYTTGRRGG
jgi:hypothetical protein